MLSATERRRAGERAEFGRVVARWRDSPLQQCCGTVLTPTAWSHLQLKELWATGPAALRVGPGATLAAGLSDLVL